MTIERLPNESDLDYKYRILLDKARGTANYGWEDVEKALNVGVAKDTIRKGTFFLPEFDEYLRNKLSSNNELPSYKEVNEYKADGSQVSDKLIRISEQDMKNPDKLLEAHGYDHNQFELVNSRSSMWNSSVDKTLHSSRITVKPKVNGFDIDELVKATKEAIIPSKLEYNKTEGKNLLCIPFVDLHFGINTFQGYLEKLSETLDIIKSKNWDTIYIPFGHDLIHVNNHKGQTANGTNIEMVDLTKAWKDALKFYKVIFNEAIKNSQNVVADYVCGNHDADMTWAFAQLLEEIYPQVKFDTSINNKKYFKWNKILLVNLHGEKGMNRVAKTLITKYRDLMVDAKTVEIHSGHLHAEKVKDEYGIIVRTLPTSALEDNWHVENSFEGACKHSQIFEYNAEKLKTIYHV